MTRQCQTQVRAACAYLRHGALTVYICAAAEQRRCHLLGAWGKVEEWSFDQVHTYIKTNKMLARYVARSDVDIDWPLIPGHAIASAWADAATPADRQSEVEVLLAVAGFGVKAKAAARFLCVAVNYGKCLWCCVS